MYYFSLVFKRNCDSDDYIYYKSHILHIFCLIIKNHTIQLFTLNCFPAFNIYNFGEGG